MKGENVRTRENEKKGDLGGEAHLVHSNVCVFRVIVRENNAHRVSALLPLEQHSVATEQLQLLHLGRAQTHDRVIVVVRVVHHQTVRRLLLVHDPSIDVLDVRHSCFWAGFFLVILFRESLLKASMRGMLACQPCSTSISKKTRACLHCKLCVCAEFAIAIGVAKRERCFVSGIKLCANSAVD